jgi:hypothetical protein
MGQHPDFITREVVAFEVMIQIHSAASASGRVRDEIAPPDQVVGRGAKGKHPIDEAAPPVAEFTKQRHRLQPPKGLLDQLALALTARVARMPGGAAINRAPAARPMVLRDVGRHAHRPQGSDARAGIKQFVGGDGDPTTRQGQVADHRDRGIAFGRAACARDRGIDDQAVAGVGQQVTQIRELGFVPTRFLIQARVRIRGGLMRVIAARLPVEIDRRILRIIGRPPRAVLRLEALVTRPRFQQRPIDREVLVGEQPVGLDRREDFRKERGKR